MIYFNRAIKSVRQLGRVQWSRSGDRGQMRSAMFRLAILSSAVSKVFGLVLQAVALPLVLRALGQHDFALYLLLTAILATIALTQMGAGPGLTQGIARANAAGDRKGESALLGAAFRLTGSAALMGGVLALVVLYVIPPDKLFGAAFQNDRAVILSASQACIFVLIAQVTMGVVDSALAGYQEQVFVNIASAIGNIASIFVLMFACAHGPSITKIILVLYGVPTLFRSANLCMLLIRRPYLTSGLFVSDRSSYKPLVNVGIAFWLIQITGVLGAHCSTFLLAHMSTTSTIDFFGVALKVLSLAGAVVGMITQPLWPAIADSIAHQDVAWIRRSYSKIRSFVALYSVAAAILLVWTGPWILERMTHIKYAGTSWLIPVLAAYFVANNWTHLLYTTMMGMRVIWQVVVVLIVETFLLIALGLLLVPHFGALGMAFAYLAASLLLPAWLLPRLMNRALAKI